MYALLPQTRTEIAANEFKLQTILWPHFHVDTPDLPSMSHCWSSNINIHLFIPIHLSILELSPFGIKDPVLASI